MSSPLLAILGRGYSAEHSVTSLHSHSLLVGSVHGCTSSTFLIARSGHRCAVILTVHRGEYAVNTLAGVGVPLALSIGLVCENLAACCAHAMVVGRRTLVYKHCSYRNIDQRYKYWDTDFSSSCVNLTGWRRDILYRLHIFIVTVLG